MLNDRLRASMPGLLTFYDQDSKAQCMQTCTSGGTATWQCAQTCQWVCAKAATGVSETQYGYCSTGCSANCGEPARPVSSYSSIAPEIDFTGFDASGDGKIDPEEARMALLWVFSNCTYYIMRASDHARYRHIATQYHPV